MRLFSATTFLISALSAPLLAQQPAPVILIQHQEFYPRETIAVFGMNPIGPHRAELEKTGLYDLLSESPEFGQILPQAMAKVSLATGLDRNELETLAGSGFSLGLTAWRVPDQFDFLGVVELGDSVSQIERLLSSKGNAAGTIAGVDIYSLPTSNNEELSFCISGSSLLFANSREQIDASLARGTDPSLPSLASNARFQRVAGQLTATDSTQPLVAGYLNLGLTIDALVSMVPDENRKIVDQVIQNLALRQASALGYSALPGDGKITDHLRVSMNTEPSGVLAAFMPKVGKIDPEFNKFVPADVNAFALTHIRFDVLFDKTLMAVGAFDNQLASQLRMMMRGVASQVGVDIERDIFGSFGQRVLTLQWPAAEGATPDFAVLLELSDEARFDGALRKLTMLKHSSLDGFQLYSAPGQISVAGNGLPSLAVGEHFCVFTGSRARLERLLKHLTNPQSNVRANSLFSAQPRGTVATGWSDLGQTMQSYAKLFTRINQFGDRAGMERFRRTFEQLASSLGESETSVIRNTGGISIISRSSSGNIGGLLVGAISAASAGLSSRAVAAGPRAEPVTQQEFEQFRHLLTEIAVAELAHIEGGADPFVDLQTLADSGSIEPEELGDNRGGGTFELGSHSIHVFLPKDPAQRFEHFLVVAWPIDSATGNVYSCREDGLPLVNTLLARANGIAKIQLRDIFIGGTFNGKLTPGWRRMEGNGETASRPTTTATALADREVYGQILLAEESGKADPEFLLRVLRSENPKLVGRAAYAIGKLQMSQAVPDLINILTTHPDASVQRNAMSALKILRDPRTIQASAAALSSPDLQVRTLAAQNLGRLRKQTAVEPLLGFLANEPGHNDDSKRPDRVQAILSLCDIGDFRSLLPAANSVHVTNSAEEQALTYMFQQLTAKMEPDEQATTLMTVLDHKGVLLRRYAIQRLGELKNKNSISALQERLPLEGPQLRPLIQLALQGMLGESKAKPRVGSRFALIKLRQWKQQATEYWQGLEPKEQNKLVAASGGSLILLLILLLVSRRHRRQKRAMSWASEMVSPSEEEEFAAGEIDMGDFPESFASEEADEGQFEAGATSFQLPPEASMPTGEGWEHAELGVAPGDDEGYREEGFIS